MSNSSRVGEIFTSAGAALNLLGELTKQLESSGSSGPGSGTKWSEQEILMLQNAVRNFANDLSIISETLKSRTVHQIKGTLQRKAYEDARLPLPSTRPIQQVQVMQAKDVEHLQHHHHQESEVTLNMLNAADNCFE